MSKDRLSLYEGGHLFVAAVRLWTHQRANAPSLEEVCRTLGFSLEQGGLLLRRLEKHGIVETVEGGYGGRLFIRDHLALEALPRETEDHRLDDELKKFRENQRRFAEKIESLRAEQTDKKKSLFAEMEKKLKEELAKKGKPPE